MSKSAIEWTTYTWNPVTGCSKVSPGCDHCYAERLSLRFKRSHYPWEGRHAGMNVKLWPERLEEPLRVREPSMFFVCSMGDLFHERVPWEFIVRVFNVMAACHRHTFQVLTKRPGRMAYFAEQVWPKQGGRWEPVTDYSEAVRGPWPGTRWPRNVWAGTSVESQRYAPRLDVLARVPAPVRFVSCEPLLGPLDLRRWLVSRGICDICGGEPRAWATLMDEHNNSRWWHDLKPVDSVLQWVIIGGESGPGARPFDLAWARDIIRQCREAQVPCFVKQVGSRPIWAHADLFGGRGVPVVNLQDPKGADPAEWPADLRVREMPEREKEV